MARVAVIGAGYVGLTTAACLTELGHTVACADIDPHRIASLQRAEIPIRELGLADLVERGLESGRLSFVLGAATAARRADFHFLCLPTPQGADGGADISFVVTAVAEIGPVLPTGSVVVNKSTVPVGTAALVEAALDRSDVTVASNPEFLREGTAVSDFLHPDRVVVGSDDVETRDRVGDLYAPLDTVVVKTDARSAELIKYASNAYLATKLTFVNEMAEICEQLDANIDDVMLGMGHDRRIGTSYLSPGPGWGGSCFPKDTEALVHIATQVDCEFDFLRHVIELNARHIERTARKVAAFVDGDVKGKRIAAWGLTFKAETDDLRDSPAIAVLRSLAEQGADICACDPAIVSVPETLPDIEIQTDPIAAARGAEVLVVLTEWSEFAKVDLGAVGEVMASRQVVDARNLLDRSQLEIHGFSVVGIGR